MCVWVCIRAWVRMCHACSFVHACVAMWGGRVLHRVHVRVCVLAYSHVYRLKKKGRRPNEFHFVRNSLFINVVSQILVEKGRE